MSAPRHQPRIRSSGPRCRRCLTHPPAPAATADRPVGSARQLHPRDVVDAERLKRSATATSSGAPTHRDPRTCAARRSCCRARRSRPRRGGITKRYRMAEQRAVCAAVPVRALLQLPLLGVERGYKGLYPEVGGLLEVWEPLAPRWAPRMHVRTNIMKSGRF